MISASFKCRHRETGKTKKLTLHSIFEITQVNRIKPIQQLHKANKSNPKLKYKISVLKTPKIAGVGLTEVLRCSNLLHEN